MRKPVSMDKCGFTVSGYIITGDWEGDSDVVNGIHYLDPYIEDCTVTAPDGTDITDKIIESAIEAWEEELLEQVDEC